MKAHWAIVAFARKIPVPLAEEHINSVAYECILLLMKAIMSQISQKVGIFPRLVGYFPLAVVSQLDAFAV